MMTFKRVIVVVMLMVAFVVVNQAQEATQEPEATFEVDGGTLSVSGDSVELDVDAGTLTINGLNNSLALNYIVGDETFNSYMDANYWANGWKFSEGLTANAILEVESLITSDSGDTFLEVFNVSLVLSNPQYDDVTDRIIFDVVVSDVVPTIDEKSELVSDNLALFMLFIEYSPEYNEALQAGITAYEDSARPTTSRRCNPRRACR
jgi:hypothetical protein